MCGIIGWVSTENSIPLKKLKVGNDLIRHRGPDDEGYWIKALDDNSFSCSGEDTVNELRKDTRQINEIDNFAKVALAHRRLSIIDTSFNGHQPMIRDKITLAFNGEIYNYKDLKESLKNSWKFESSSDTEVILAAYRKWGSKCFEKFDGMWAIAIYDGNKDKFILCRDRLGEKPLYYSQTQKTIFFASEIKSLIKSGLVDFKINRELVCNYLFTAQPKFNSEKISTFFSNIFEVEPGTYYEINIKNLKLVKRKYWDIKAIKEQKEINEEYFCKKINTIMKNSVLERLNADVPVAITLSGGLDSSIIAFLSNKIRNKNKIVCYSWKKDEKDEDFIHSRIMANFLNVEQRWVTQKSSEAWDGIKNFIYMHDEPPIEAGGMSLGGNRLYKAASKDGFKVVLEGVGPDEFLAGYPGYFSPNYLFEYIKRENLFKAFKELNLWMDNEGRNISWVLKRTILKLMGNLSFTFNLVTIKSLFSKNIRMINKFAIYKQDVRKTLKKLSSVKGKLSLRDAKLFYIKSENFPRYLDFADKNSMMYSVEGRFPFLTKDIIELFLCLPPSALLKNGYGKYLLRKAFESKMPSSIIWRKKKQGFSISKENWLEDNKEDIINTIEKSQFLKTLINDKKLNRFIKKSDISLLDREEYNFIWRCFALSVWESCYLENDNLRT